MNRWPIRKAYFWETAPFFRVLLPFVAGIVCYDHKWFTGGRVVVIACVAFPVYAAMAYMKRSNSWYSMLTMFVLSITLFFSGVAVSNYGDVRNDKPWFGNTVNDNSTCLARLTGPPIEKEHVWKTPVHVITTIKDGKVSAATGNAFIYIYKDRYPMLLHKGDSIWVLGKWQPIKNAGNPFEFDYAGYCHRNNVFFQQFCGGNSVRLYASADPQATALADKCHDWCMQHLDTYLHDAKTKGLIQAMLLGDEVNLDEDLRQSYAETGIIHIIAISGGNVAIFFVVISFLLRWLRHKKHVWIKYAIALPLVWFYIFMAGAPPSAVRAAIMFSLLAFSVMLQKNNNSLNQLFATAFILLCGQPMWLFSLGFQLSFVAVLSLILFYKPIYKWLAPVNKIARLIWGTIAASLAAEVLVAPLVIYYFHTFPLLFLVANVAAYLFMSLALFLGIAIIALSFIPIVAHYIALFTQALVSVFDKMVSWMQNCNPASFHFLVLTGVELVITYIAISGLTVFLVRRQKVALFISLGACSLLIASFCIDEWKALHQQKFILYNVSKANHTELIKGKEYVVVSTDTAATKKISYATKPAHTNLRAWHVGGIDANEITVLNGKSLLILNTEIDTNTEFHIDNLILNQPALQDPRKLKRIFSPSLMIIGSNYTQKQQDKFLKACAEAGMSVHSVTRDGAFVLD